MEQKFETVVFGGGCFWCTEALFKSLKGVASTEPGYVKGVEVVKIEFDLAIISFTDLLAVFFNTHDPTTPNRQGADVGEQYRSVIFYTTEEQKIESEKIIVELEENRAYENKIVTKVEKSEKFVGAEDYHKNYYEMHQDAPYCQLVIAPKLEKLNKRFKELLK